MTALGLLSVDDGGTGGSESAGLIGGADFGEDDITVDSLLEIACEGGER